MNTIDARSKSVRELLDGMKYTIDYYQREYKWETKQIVELLQDLEAKFLDNYNEVHERVQVEHYSHYFLGSIIICNRNGQKFIIDGQQRLTSLTLLLIYLHNLQKELDEHVDIRNLIFSEKYGKKSFNLDIAERTACVDALYNGEHFDIDGQAESVGNIALRYSDIEEYFPAILKGQALPYFIDWFKENVLLVEINAYSDEDAYTIFETMNDRGLSLSPTDMLKGYLLANISDGIEKAHANEHWKAQLSKLTSLSKEGKEDEADFFKAWLRGKYADSIREGKKGAKPRDFEIIGTAFHKWTRDNKDQIGLKKSADFRHFVMDHFKYFSERYVLLRESAQDLHKAKKNGLEYVFYNSHNNFTLQYPLILAPLKIEDDLDTALRKIRLVAGYLDILIIRRAVNFRTLDYSSIVYTMFNLIKEIREMDIPTLVDIFKSKVSKMEETFDGLSNFYLNTWSKRYIHHMLARITSHIEEESGKDSNFYTYVSREAKKPFEIEHIWANQYSRHKDEFENEEAFSTYRNRFGGLLLLPRGYNQSLGDKPYEDKVQSYTKQNLLARSLSEQGYQNEPSFLSYVKYSGHPFRPHKEFRKADLDARQSLYQLICEEIWSPARFDRELEGYQA